MCSFRSSIKLKNPTQVPFLEEGAEGSVVVGEEVVVGGEVVVGVVEGVDKCRDYLFFKICGSKHFAILVINGGMIIAQVPQKKRKSLLLTR